MTVHQIPGPLIGHDRVRAGPADTFISQFYQLWGLSPSLIIRMIRPSLEQPIAGPNQAPLTDLVTSHCWTSIS